MEKNNNSVIVNCRDCHDCLDRFECSIGKALGTLPIEISLNELQIDGKKPIISFIDGDNITGIDLVCDNYDSKRVDLKVLKNVTESKGTKYIMKFLGCDSCRNCISSDVCKYKNTFIFYYGNREFALNEIISMIMKNPIRCNFGISLHCAHFTHENIIIEALSSRREKIIPNGH